MRRYLWLLLIIVGLLGAGSLSPAGSAEAPTLDLETIISGIEQCYAGRGFSATFFQESMLKAMQISDTAEGRLTVRRPGKMRWEYTLPDEQVIITNSSSMWIYRAADRQVMVGRAPDFFGQGKGAGFLSDIRQIRNSFTITLAEAQSEGYYRLQLKPLKPTPDLADIILSVAKTTYQVDQVITHNAYGDETRIVLGGYQFNIEPDESLFNFDIPEGIDVIQLEAS
jgi:outer membrane lipoprotein carrier protein